MTVRDRVRKYLTDNAQRPFCDLCLTREVRAKERQGVRKASADLAATDPVNFRRDKRQCSFSHLPDHITRPKLCIAYIGADPLVEL